MAVGRRHEKDFFPSGSIIDFLFTTKEANFASMKQIHVNTVYVASIYICSWTFSFTQLKPIYVSQVVSKISSLMFIL